MAQDKFTISTTEYNLNITGYNESNETILTEIPTIIDPSDYDADNSVLIASGRKKQVFSIDGWCTISNRNTFVSALRSNTKVYPEIYPNGGATNIFDANNYYYIQSFSGSFISGSDIYWYNMALIYGGVF